MGKDGIRSFGTMESGNRVTLLVDGEEAYPAMLEAIASARQTILMDSYIFNNDAAGRLFAEALRERAGAGVQVHLTVDAIGTINVPEEFFEELRRSNIAVLEYRPVAPWRRGWGLLRRNHRKLLVVDGRVGFAGGINIGDAWLPQNLGGQGWHDIHVRVEGPAVRTLSRISSATWRSSAGLSLSPRLFQPEVEPVGDTDVSVVGSRERKKRRSIRGAYLRAIRHAKRYVYIANAYFIPDLGLRRALRNAARRGVDVRVMVPARGDILPVQLASQALLGRALRAGLRVFQWQGAMLHAKTAVIDDEWATVGSFNLDHRSWSMNLEVNVNVVEEEFALRLRDVYERDETRCVELTREVWRARPLWKRLVERFFFLFHRWM
jgi:cardiolipin synthase